MGRTRKLVSTRQREWSMRQFKSITRAKRFFFVPSVVRNLFELGDSYYAHAMHAMHAITDGVEQGRSFDGGKSNS